jgi:hypothetical protein
MVMQVAFDEIWVVASESDDRFLRAFFGAEIKCELVVL